MVGGLRDKQAQARISARFLCLAAGNFGDCTPLRDGVWEMRIDWGPAIDPLGGDARDGADADGGTGSLLNTAVLE